MFNNVKFVDDVKAICWSEVLSTNNPETALSRFNNLFLPLVETHAPLKKFVVRNIVTPWLDDEIKDAIKKRDQMKRTAMTTGNKADWDLYRKMRTSVTKLNKKKKKIYFENQLQKVGNDSKKLWNVLNQLTGKKNKVNPSFLEADNKFIIKPVDIADYTNDYFISKLDKLGENMPNLSNVKSHLLMRNKIMKNKNTRFKLEKVSTNKVKEFLKSCKDKPPGVDSLDLLLKLVAVFIAPVLAHIINLSFTCSTCPQTWKQAKIIPLPKNKKLPFSTSNS